MVRNCDLCLWFDDHVPKMVNDSSWNHRGRAYTTGYMIGLLQAVNTLEK